MILLYCGVEKSKTHCGVSDNDPNPLLLSNDNRGGLWVATPPLIDCTAGVDESDSPVLNSSVFEQSCISDEICQNQLMNNNLH